MACSNPRKTWGPPQKIVPQGCEQPGSDLSSFAQDTTSVYPKDTTYTCQGSDATDWTAQKLKESACPGDWTAQKMTESCVRLPEGANTFSITPAGSYGTFSSIINLNNVKEERCISRGVFDLKIKPQTVFLVYYSFEQRNNNPNQPGTSQNDGSGAEGTQNQSQPQVNSFEPLGNRMSSSGRQYPSQYDYNTERSSNNPPGSYALKYNNPPAGFSFRSPLTTPRPFPPSSKIPKSEDAKPDNNSAEMTASQYDIEKLNAYLRSRSPVNRNPPQSARNETYSPQLTTYESDQGINQISPYAKRYVCYPKRRICTLPEDAFDQCPDVSERDQLRTRSPEAYVRLPIGYADIHNEQKRPIRNYPKTQSPNSEELESLSFSSRGNRSDSSQMYNPYGLNSAGESHRTQRSPSLIKREEGAKDIYPGIPLTKTTHNIYQVETPKYSDNLPPSYRPPARQRSPQKPEPPGEDSWYSPSQSQEAFNTFNVEYAQSPSHSVASRSTNPEPNFCYRSPPAQEQQKESSTGQDDYPVNKQPFREFQRKILGYSPIKKVSANSNYSALNSRYSTDPDSPRDDNSFRGVPSSPTRYQPEVGLPRRTSYETATHQLGYDQKEAPPRSPPRDPYNPPIPRQKSQSQYQDVERYKDPAPSTSSSRSESPRGNPALMQRMPSELSPKAVRTSSVGQERNFHQENESNRTSSVGQERIFHQEYDSNRTSSVGQERIFHQDYDSNSEYAETSHKGNSQAPSSTVPIYSVAKNKYSEEATLQPDENAYFNAYTTQQNQQIPLYVERYLRHQGYKYARDEDPPPYELYDVQRFAQSRQLSNTALAGYDRAHTQIASASFQPSIRSNDYEPNDYPVYRPPTDYYRTPIGYPPPRPYLPYEPYRPDGYYSRYINRYPYYPYGHPYGHPYELEYISSSPPFIPFPPNFRSELDYLDLVSSRSMSRWYEPPVMPPARYNYPPRVYPAYERLPRQISVSCTSINGRFPMSPEYMQTFCSMGIQDVINNPFNPNMQEIEQCNIVEQRQNTHDEKPDKKTEGLLHPDKSGDVHAQKHVSPDNAKNNSMAKSQRKKDTGDSASLDSQSLRYQTAKSVPSKRINPEHIKSPTAVKRHDTINN